jgi:streptogramin lyase
LARSQRSVIAGVAVVIALAGMLVAGRWLQPRLDRAAPGAATPTSPAQSRPAPTSRTVATTVPSGSPGITRTAETAQVDAIAVTSRWVWVAAGGLVLRVDPETRRSFVVPGIETAEPPVVRLVATAGAVWATTTGGRRLLRIDPRAARVVASLPVPAQGVAADRDGVWVVCCEAGGGRGRLTRVDPASGRVLKVLGLPGHPYAVGTGPSGVWALGAGGLLWRVDPGLDRVVATIRMPPGDLTGLPADSGASGGDVVVTRDAVWVSDPAAGAVWRIDPRRNRVTDYQAEAAGSDLTLAADGVVWATSDTRLLGLGGPDVVGPRRNLWELATDRITATAAAGDGGLWLGTPQGLFHVSRSVLRQP